MSDPQKPTEEKQISTEDWNVGYMADGAIMLITIPLRKWAYAKDGDLLMAGAMHKARAIGLRNLKVIKEEDKKNGLWTPPKLSEVVQ
jgi:hypothetical protein